MSSSSSSELKSPPDLIWSSGEEKGRVGSREEEKEQRKKGKGEWEKEEEKGKEGDSLSRFLLLHR